MLINSSLVASIVIAWATTLYIWSRRSAPGAKQLAMMMGLVGWWGLPFLLRALDDNNASTRLLTLKLEYVSVVSVPFLWLWFALVYTGKDAWLSPKRLGLLALIPCVTLVLALTAEAHNLIVDFRDTPLTPTTGVEYIYWKRGAWGWFNTFYQYIVLAVGTFVLLRGLSSLHHSYRPQVIPLLITIVVAWGVNILYAADQIPPTWPIAPLSFTFFGLGVSWSLYRHRLLDIVPIARDALVEGMSDAVFVLDTQQRIVDVNPAGQHLLRQSSGVLIGQSINQALPSLSDLFQAQMDSPARREIEWGAGSDTRRVYDANVSCLHSRQGQATGYLCVLRDVTELEFAREQAQAADRAKSEFLSNVSHELRTPLTSVKLYLDLLKRGRLEKQQTYLETILREVERLQTLIEGVLTISRLDLGKLVSNVCTVDLNSMLQTLHQDRRMLFEKQGLELKIQTAPDLPTVDADPQLLEQVITNLLTNAMNYTPPGGMVNLSATLLETDHTPWVTIAVRDTGWGISQEEQRHIFERFRRGAASQVTKIPGTGLGLAICQEIVHLHNGHITLDSQEGTGSTFTVWLPIN